MGIKRLVELVTVAGMISISQTAVASDSDTGTLTVGQEMQHCGTGTTTTQGYIETEIGSYSPTGLTGGATVADLFNQVTIPAQGGTQCPAGNTQFEATGFSSNPGKSWLISIECSGTTATVSSTTEYSYGDGVAWWEFTSVALTLGNEGSMVSCTITHN